MQQIITEYLKEQALKDSAFADKFDESKVTECVDYIYSVAQKKASSGRCAMSDASVYKLARDFFNDGLHAPKNQSKPRVAHLNEDKPTESDNELKLSIQANAPKKEYIPEQCDLFAGAFA